MTHPLIGACPKCGLELELVLSHNTMHYGYVKCPHHGHIWISKSPEEKKTKRKTNGTLISRLPEGMQDFCWECLRSKKHLLQLRPSLSLQVHHIIEVKDGGTDDADNLQLLCAECHAECHRRRETFRRYDQPSDEAA